MVEFLSNMHETQFLTRLFCSMACALMISYLTSKFIGPANKAQWFRKREKFSFFLKRGFLGEECHFGYPRTKEGFLVAAAMLVAIAVTTVVIFVI